MTVFMYPTPDEKPWPTLGPFVCDFIEDNLCFGPGDLLGSPVTLSDELRAWICKMYEVEPPYVTTGRGHSRRRRKNPRAGRRRFQRCVLSLRKGSSKTEIAAWIAACELHPDGPVRCAGFDGNQPIPCGVRDPYIPMISYTEEQTEELAYGALRRIIEESRVSGDFDIGLNRIMRARGDGKAEAVTASPNARDGARTTWQHADEALALDTPLPTPGGWTTMEKVQVGDLLFGRDGQLCRVLGKSDVHYGRPCYRVAFEDGTSVIADANHLWMARRTGGCGHGRGCRCWRAQGWGVRRTADMLDVIVHDGPRPRFRYHVPVAQAIQTPEVQLPVDPYVLGVWLGDGDSENAMISAAFSDAVEMAGALKDCGYAVTTNAQRTSMRMYVTGPDSRSGRRGLSVVGKLRALGLLRNKHVPDLYLRSGVKQRLALMQGLMDSDGHVSKRGDCTFVNTNQALIGGFVELARSLGLVPSVHWREDDRKSSYLRVAKVGFQSDLSMPVFRLTRKRDRLRTRRQPRHDRLAIVSIDRVDSVPVQCVKVDAPDSLYLAGVGMVPTHNTHRLILDGLKRAWTVMLANLAKRPMADPWALETTTAPEPGADSVAEGTMRYAYDMAEKAGNSRARLFFYHRQASDKHDLDTDEGLRSAIVEASGPYIAKWSDIDRIMETFREPDADLPYLERVWLNRPVQAAGLAFDVERWQELAQPDHVVPNGALITLGFDGSRYDDATALVATEVETGFQWPLGIWARPPQQAEWEVPVLEVDGIVDDAFSRWEVVRMYCDPPKWEGWIATWAGRYGDKRVVEWWTNRRKPMAYALRAFKGAVRAGEVIHNGDRTLETHIANCRRLYTKLTDDEGKQLWILRKERPDSPKKIDAAMAAVLSWEARIDAVADGLLVGVGEVGIDFI